MWTFNISCTTRLTLAVLGLSALTACLDLPIQGEVSGQSMNWVASSITLEEPLVAVKSSSGDTAPAAEPSMQVLLSDFRASCDAVDRLASPGEGLHTLALTLIPRAGDDLIQPGEYRIGGAQSGEEGSAVASFLTGMRDQVEREDAVSGVLVVTDALGTSLQGKLHLQFPGGKLSGYFSSATCSDAVAGSAPAE
jgi:hypothetical protein